MSYQPGTYQKDGKTRVANSAADAVALRFEGYSLVEDAPAPAPEDAPADPAHQPEEPEAVAPGAPAPKPTAPSKKKD